MISLSTLFASEGRQPRDVTHAILSSVVPPVVPIWERVCAKIFGQAPQIVGPGIRTGMPVRYENPHEVGADRIVNAVATFELFGGPAIAVDFGTATTFDCISGTGRVPRWRDLPGHPDLDGGALRAGLEAPPGGDRQAQIRDRPDHDRGPPVGPALRLRRPRRFDEHANQGELGAEARVVATGGLARLIAAECTTIDHVAPFLTLDGLRILFEKNRHERS